MCNRELTRVSGATVSSACEDMGQKAVASTVCHVIITERHLCALGLLAQLERAATQFVPKPRCVIVREKDLGPTEYETLFHQVCNITSQYQIPTMVHGQPDLAVRLVRQQIQDSTPSMVAGVHLPLAQWAAWRQAHRREAAYLMDLGHLASQYPCGVGVSVHSLADAIAAEKLGVSYVMAGHIFKSACKPGVPPRGLSLLHSIIHHVSCPVYAIGGFSWADSKAVAAVTVGATGVAVRSDAMTR